jgi:hypothetical protein
MPPKRPVSDRGSVLRPASWRRRPKPTHEALRRVRVGRTRDRALPTPTASARTTQQPSTPQQTSTPVVHSADLSVAALALDASEQRREARRASKGPLLLDKRASLRAPGSRLGGKSSGSAGRDRCASTKAVLRDRPVDMSLTVGLDETEQSQASAAAVQRGGVGGWGPAQSDVDRGVERGHVVDDAGRERADVCRRRFSAVSESASAAMRRLLEDGRGDRVDVPRGAAFGSHGRSTASPARGCARTTGMWPVRGRSWPRACLPARLRSCARHRRRLPRGAPRAEPTI